MIGWRCVLINGACPLPIPILLLTCALHNVQHPEASQNGDITLRASNLAQPPTTRIVHVCCIIDLCSLNVRRIWEK